MSEPSILFVKPKAINARDKKTLSAAGVIVIEVENVADVKFTRPSSSAPELPNSALLHAASKAIADYPHDGPKTLFGLAICAAIQAEAESKS